MGKYIVIRLAYFIPTLLLISLLAFIISIAAPGDPVLSLLTEAQGEGASGDASSNFFKQKQELTRQLGLHLPIFYCSFTTIATPDTLYKIEGDQEKMMLKRLLNQYGNWPQIQGYRNAIVTLNQQVSQLKIQPSNFPQFTIDQIGIAISEVKEMSYQLQFLHEHMRIHNHLLTMEKLTERYQFFEPLKKQILTLQNNYTSVYTTTSKWRNYIPAIHFYAQNQYHRWLFGDGNWITAKGAIYSKGIIRGDFGISLVSKRPIAEVFQERFKWSFTLSAISVLLAYLISIPIGLRAAAKRNSLFDRSSSVILFLFYSMPSFWLATLLIMTFSNPDVLLWLPASQIGPVTGIPENTTFLQTMRIRLPYLILPIITYTYAQLAFLSRITRVAALEILNQDYIRTARAKGLREYVVIYKHVFRNALLPIITVFANIFPAAIGGSVIIETIFTLPGMGSAIVESIYTKDYPMIVSVFTITGALTLFGYLLADILYAIADPRISFHHLKL